MKNLIIVIVLSNILLFPQTSKEEKLEWIKSRGDIKVTEEKNDIYRFKYPDGRIQYFYLGKTETNKPDTIPTTVIETWNVDTTLYQDLYSFWQEVPVVTASTYELTIGDMNRNGLLEIYGHTKDYEDPLMQPIEVFELDTNNNFIYRYSFPDSLVIAKGIYDIKNIGQENLLITSVNGNAVYYSSLDAEPLSFMVDFDYSRYTPNEPGQMDHPKLGDLDRNGITDLLFYDMTGNSVTICEYSDSINNFHTIMDLNYSTGFYVGFASGDFDMDGKTDIVYGSLEGKVIVIEAEGEHNYSIVWETEIVGCCSYMQLITNDIDNNGTPEFWISSITYNGVTEVTSFTSFEYASDNVYKEIYRIDFVGVFPLYAGNAFSNDVDKDGIDELVICISDYIFIMQFKGSSANPSYEIKYMTRNSIPGGYFGVTMYDLNNDGLEELLINRDIIRFDGKSKRTTYIYKPDFVVRISDKENYSVSSYFLYQNYPNPFNPATTISYYLPKSSYVSLTVFDILGNKVKVLDEGERIEGKHTIHWNGKDKFQDNFSSGIYFIQFVTPEFKQTIKGVMLN